MLTVYTTSWCGYCLRLKRQLEREGIPFTEVKSRVLPPSVTVL